jgi:predicted transporter
MPVHLRFLLARRCVLVFVHIGFQIERQWQRREWEARTWLVVPVPVPVLVPAMALEVVQASLPAPMEESWHGDMLLWLV